MSRRATAAACPYETLGVPRSASTADVRRAYRRKAKHTHPDAGGNAQQFSELSKAHDLLLDPVRRLSYDTTGSTEEAKPDNQAAAALGVILSLVEQILTATDRDPTRSDLIADMKNSLDAGIQQAENKLRSIEASAAHAEKLAKRFRRKKGENFIKRMLDDKARALRANVVAGETEIKTVQLAISMLNDYSFDFDKVAEPTMMMFGRIMTTTTTSATR